MTRVLAVNIMEVSTTRPRKGNVECIKVANGQKGERKK